MYYGFTGAKIRRKNANGINFTNWQKPQNLSLSEKML